ncbi:MAG: GDSL-type esterase/lipase family protein [Chitinophagaceae bacterium]
MKKLFSLIGLLLSFGALFAQAGCPPFWNDILQFRKADSALRPEEQSILLVGSSSFTNWKDVADYFPGYKIINRGFGGSSLPDVIRYAYDVILPYNPKQVLIYCGENDLASSDTVKAAHVVARFKTLYGMIRQNLPQTVIHFVSLKPSPSRRHLMAEMKKVNSAIKGFLAGEKKAGFIDVYSAMLDKTGNAMEDIFLADKLHMKPNGYVIWQRVIRPYLMK